MMNRLLFRAKVKHITPAVFRLTHGRWRRPGGRPPRPGYSLILNVPPDLPVFLHLASEVCSRQDSEGLVETLVIPDHVDPGFRRHFDQFAANWPLGPTRLVELPPLDRAIRRLTTNTSMIHWLQIINACEQVTSSYALLHDVDLFLFDRGFFRERHRSCLGEGLRFLGVDRRIDMALGADEALGRINSDRIMFPELEHLLSTWELMFEVPWLREFRPSQLRGQYVELRGMFKYLDTLHVAQLQAGPAQVVCRPATADFVHFAAVISHYRGYHWSKGPFHDWLFRLLLTRLLVNAFDPDTPYDLPTIDEMADGIGRTDRPVIYKQDETSRGHFVALRRNLRRIADGGLFQASQMAAIEDGLDRFGGRYEAASP